jgi:hypothetical protein
LLVPKGSGRIRTCFAAILRPRLDVPVREAHAADPGTLFSELVPCSHSHSAGPSIAGRSTFWSVTRRIDS